MSNPVSGARPRLAALDALRGVAILGVVAVHASGIIGERIDLLGVDLRKLLIWSGQYGVELFFLLSGLTIAWSYRTHGQEGERILSAYFLRRFFRLSPMYYMTLAVLAAAGYNNALEPDTVNPPADLRNFALHATYTHGLFPEYVRSILGPAWSLTPEVIFYFTLPAILFFCRTPGARVFFFILMTGMSEWYSRHWSIFMEPTTTNYIWSTIAPPRIFFLFAGGVVLSDVFLWRGRGVPSPGDRILGGVANAIFVGSVIGFHVLYYTDANSLWIWLMIVAGVLAFCLQASWLRPLLGWRPLQKLGLVSYSIFLVHFPIIDWWRPIFAARLTGAGPVISFGVFFTAILGASWLIAHQTYRWIERPGIALGNRLVQLYCRNDPGMTATGTSTK